jgi:hypothetical protein
MATVSDINESSQEGSTKAARGPSKKAILNSRSAINTCDARLARNNLKILASRENGLPKKQR